MSGLLDRVLPKVEFSLTDLLEEVESLREENGALRAQVKLLSHIGGPVVDPRQEAMLTCLSTEVAHLEQTVERARLRGTLEREELAMRCDELGRALEQRILQAERVQHEAEAAARHQSADTIANLEEQLAVAVEDLARREALADAYGADAELEEAEARVHEARAVSEREAEQARALRDEMERLRASHAEELQGAARRAEQSQAEAAEAAKTLQAKESVVASLQAQLVRLSEGFNKQVEEVYALQGKLEQSKATSIDKALARSWVVNFVEQGRGAHGDALLQLMADWWEFSDEDRQRVGLADTAHPSVEAALYGAPPSLSLADSFKDFLDAESTEPPRHAPRAGGRSREPSPTILPPEYPPPRPYRGGAY